jgi:hypothetical protein
VTPPISAPGSAWLEIIVPARNEQARLPAGLERLDATSGVSVGLGTVGQP